MSPRHLACTPAGPPLMSSADAVKPPLAKPSLTTPIESFPSNANLIHSNFYMVRHPTIRWPIINCKTHQWYADSCSSVLFGGVTYVDIASIRVGTGKEHVSWCKTRWITCYHVVTTQRDLLGAVSGSLDPRNGETKKALNMVDPSGVGFSRHLNRLAR